MNEASRQPMRLRHSKFSIRLFIFALLISSIARADVLTLDDGTKVEGKAKKDGDQWIVTDAQGHQTDVDASRVVLFEIGGGSNSDSTDTPATRLATLRNTVDHFSDLNQIIQRYKTYLANPNNDAAQSDAQADLKMWQGRLSDGYIKIGDRWLTPMERDELASTEAAAAANMEQLIRQGNIDAARDALDKAIADDPDDPAARYLHGLLSAQQGNMPVARADYERELKTIQNHAPTSNNYAIVLYRQRLYGAALNSYINAMKAKPADKIVLDNVIEALHALPQEYRDTPPAKNAAAVLTDQDKVLTAAQNADGQFRWGSGWVNADLYAKLEAEDQTIQAQLTAVESDYERTQATINSDNDQIARTQQVWNSYNQVNPYNGFVTTPSALPQDYYQVAQDLQFYITARNNSIAHLNDLQAQADKLQNSYSTPKFTGVQQLYGPEGTPLRNDQPATPPPQGPG